MRTWVPMSGFCGAMKRVENPDRQQSGTPTFLFESFWFLYFQFDVLVGDLACRGAESNVKVESRFTSQQAPSMAGALSLQEDIIALVEKHSDTCLPEYLLRRLAEEARLLAAREEIR